MKGKSTRNYDFELNVRVVGKKEIERFISIVNLGLIIAIEQELITCDDAEGRLYNPRTYHELESLGIDGDLMSAIDLGMMDLDSIQRHTPESFPEAVQEMKKASVNTIRLLELEDEKEKDEWISWDYKAKSVKKGARDRS